MLTPIAWAINQATGGRWERTLTSSRRKPMPQKYWHQADIDTYEAPDEDGGAGPSIDDLEGDGEGDVWFGMNTALPSLNRHPGTIFLPAGVYYIRDTIRLFTGQRLVGAGAHEDGTVLVKIGDGPCIESLPTSDFIAQHDLEPEEIFLPAGHAANSGADFASSPSGKSLYDEGGRPGGRLDSNPLSEDATIMEIGQGGDHGKGPMKVSLLMETDRTRYLRAKACGSNHMPRVYISDLQVVHASDANYSRDLRERYWGPGTQSTNLDLKSVQNREAMGIFDDPYRMDVAIIGYPPGASKDDYSLPPGVQDSADFPREHEPDTYTYTYSNANIAKPFNFPVVPHPADLFDYHSGGLRLENMRAIVERVDIRGFRYGYGLMLTSSDAKIGLLGDRLVHLDIADCDIALALTGRPTRTPGGVRASGGLTVVLIDQSKLSGTLAAVWLDARACELSQCTLEGGRLAPLVVMRDGHIIDGCTFKRTELAPASAPHVLLAQKERVAVLVRQPDGTTDLPVWRKYPDERRRTKDLHILNCMFRQLTDGHEEDVQPRLEQLDFLEHAGYPHSLDSTLVQSAIGNRPGRRDGQSSPISTDTSGGSHPPRSNWSIENLLSNTGWEATQFPRDSDNTVGDFSGQWVVTSEDGCQGIEPIAELSNVVPGLHGPGLKVILARRPSAHVVIAQRMMPPDSQDDKNWALRSKLRGQHIVGACYAYTPEGSSAHCLAGLAVLESTTSEDGVTVKRVRFHGNASRAPNRWEFVGGAGAMHESDQDLTLYGLDFETTVFWDPAVLDSGTVDVSRIPSMGEEGLINLGRTENCIYLAAPQLTIGPYLIPVGSSPITMASDEPPSGTSEKRQPSDSSRGVNDPPLSPYTFKLLHGFREETYIDLTEGSVARRMLSSPCEIQELWFEPETVPGRYVVEAQATRRDGIKPMRLAQVHVSDSGHIDVQLDLKLPVSLEPETLVRLTRTSGLKGTATLGLLVKRSQYV